MQENYDVLIVGAGPIGIACAIAAKQADLRYIVVEKGALVNSLFRFPTNMTFFSTSKLLEIGDVPFISHSEKPTRREALEYYRRVWQSWDLNINLYEQIDEIRKADQAYQITSSKATYRAQHIIICTGFYDLPVLMNVPGESLPKVKHFYDEAHHYIGQKIIVVGAANSACDVALETYHKGADVTMVVRGSAIYERVKYWIKPNIENRIKEGSIKAYFNASIEAIRTKEVDITTPDGTITVENDFVLAMTGYKPNYDALEKWGISFQKDRYRTPEFDQHFQSKQKGIYLAGVVCGGLKTNRYFIENSREHANTIISHIKSQR